MCSSMAENKCIHVLVFVELQKKDSLIYSILLNVTCRCDVLSLVRRILCYPKATAVVTLTVKT